MKTERKTAALRRGIAFLCTLVLTLMAVTLPASAEAVGGTFTVPNIGLNHDGYKKGTKPPIKEVYDQVHGADCSWTASGTQITGKVVPAEYSGKSKRGVLCWCCECSAYSPLTITNQNAQTMLLTFSYTVPEHGTLDIDGRPRSSDGTYSEPIKGGASISVKLTTAAKPQSSAALEIASKQKEYTAATTLSNITLEPLDPNVKVTFLPTTHGRYTAKVGNTSFAIGETHSKPPETVYTLQAVPDPNFFFEGWYVGNKKVSSEPTYSTYFLEDSNVSAKFIDDPLFSIIQLGKGATGDKTNYVEVNSGYIHSATGNSHTNFGDTSLNNSYGPPTKFPNSRWSVQNDTIQTSEKGIATGDNQTDLGYSKATASLYSDIICVKCKENCIITFDSSMKANSVTIKQKGQDDDQFGVFLYCYTTASAKANADTIKANGTAVIKGSQQPSASAQATQVVVNKGEYLYLYAYARTRLDHIFSALNKGYITDNYEYNATISNFTVTPNTIEHTFTTGNRDNTEAVLKSGSVKINGTPLDVSSGTNSYKAADNATLTLTPGDAPKGYTFIGWHNVTDNEYDYTNSTYKVKMTTDYQVYPIYVPAMTITTGTNGYENATYQYKDLDGNMVPRGGQFVARGPIPSSGYPKFYTDLNTAFNEQSTVFLLAEDTINGSLTIPRGKTLVIPDRLADLEPAASQPEQVTTSTGISSYCKVTLNGNLTVDGKLVVNGMQSSTANGRAAGGIGYLSLSNDATITVSNGGELCGYGQIRGGSISAESDSTVRELMEVSDKRAALVMQKIDAEKSEKRVFPFSNFSIKTIESPVTYASGAKLYAQYSIMLEGNNQSTGAVLIFGSSGALFNLTQGSMTKSFDLAADKTVYRLNEGGEMSTGSFQLDVRFGVSGFDTQTITIKSQDYWMPLNAGFDLRTAGDMTVNSDFKFLPGASLSVEKGGKCTVANGKSLLFYRLNDYDTRGSGKGEYQKGYSVKDYPVNATNLPGGGYTHPKLEKVGSARLNVDGKMIVHGGLYVSDELVSKSSQGFTTDESVNGVPMSREQINAVDFTLYPNGYNVLTGTGSIDMANAQTNQTQVYEAMTSTNTNKPAWAPIKITPIKGLAENAEADDPKNYAALDKATTYYGVYRSGGFYAWTDKMPQIAKIVGGGSSGTTYRSLADAVAAYKDTGYIQMLNNSTEPGFTVDRNVILDLNGKTVTFDGTLTVAEGKTLSGMDSPVSKDYVTAPSGKIVGTVTGTVAPTYQTPMVNEEYDRYVAIQGKEADGTKNLSFHHFNISVSGYRFELAAPQCALFFIGKFQGDEAAKDYLTSLGFTLKVKDENGENDTQLGEDNYELPDNKNEIPKMPAAGEESTSKVVYDRDGDGAYLFEVYLKRSFKKGESKGYTEYISATAQATFKNGRTQQSDPRDLSFQEAWTDKGLTTGQREILDKFLTDLGIK